MGIQKYLWDLENKFQNTFHILGHMLQNMASYRKKWQNAHMRTLGIFQIQKSIFFKVADIVRKIDIWPENDILGVLEWFGSLIWYLESSRTNFEKIEKKSHFSDFWRVGHHHVRVEISADRPEIGRIMLPTPPDTSKLFPSKNVFVNSLSFGRNPRIRVFGPGAQNRLFW